MYWIDLAQDRDSWQALLISVMNLWVPQHAGNSWPAKEQLAYQKGLWCLSVYSQDGLRNLSPLEDYVVQTAK
jgi:hypothetical protein